MASVFKQKYTAKGKDGEKVTRQSKFYYIDYKGADGTRKRVKGFKDKAATSHLATQLEKEAELARAGIVDRFKAHRTTPLSKHLNDFETTLLSKGNTAQHAQLTSSRVRAILHSCKFAFMNDISASAVLKYLADRRRQGLSIKSSNDYLQAIKQFCRWLVADRRMADSPLAHLSKQNVKTDRRHDRRALTAEEVERLITATMTGRPHHRMTGKERAFLYTFAAFTGLRANEIASLTWRSLDLESPTPGATVNAAFSKHRRQDILPLRADLAGQFCRWRNQRGEPLDARVFPRFNRRRGADMLKIDLEKAGIPYVDDSGLYADFHGLRHTFISELDHPDISPKVRQSLARHSSVALTLDTYTHPRLHSERAALDKLPRLPDLGGEAEEPSKQLKTGTDDSPVEAGGGAYKKLTKTAYSDGKRMSLDGTSGESGTIPFAGAMSEDNSFAPGDLDKGKSPLSPHDTPKKKNGPGWIRTSVGSRQRVYSPFPLATRAPTQSLVNHIDLRLDRLLNEKPPGVSTTQSNFLVIRIRRNSCAPVKIGWRDRRISDILSEKREELSDARRTPSSRGPDVTTSAESPTTGCQATRPLSSYSSGPRRPQCPGDRKDPGTQSAVRTAMGLHVSGSRLGSGRPRATNQAASQLTGDGGSVLQGAFPGRPHGGRRCLHAAW